MLEKNSQPNDEKRLVLINEMNRADKVNENNSHTDFYLP